MNYKIDAFLFRSKAVLCVMALVGMHVVAGCGTGAGLLGGTQRIDVASDSAWAGLLGGTNFEGATAIEINPFTGQFRLIYPDGGREISGTFVKSGDQARVTQLTIAVGDGAATFTFNAADQITQISNQKGKEWVRPNVTTVAPQAPQAPSAPGAREQSRLDSYMAANADLLQLAEQLDAQGGVGSVDDEQVKAGQAGFWPVALFLGFTFTGFSILATVVFVLQVAAVVAIVT